jgi:acetyl esterase
MRVHPTILADLEAAAGKEPYYRLPLPQAREAARQAWLGRAPVVPVAAVREITVPGPASAMRVRLYSPDELGSRPLVVFFHGSGFTLLDLDTHDNLCRALCVHSGCVVASVDYRLAPEHPFPAGPQDCLAATRWLAAHAEELGCQEGTHALAGDSAGGCLAAVTALRLHQDGGPRPEALVMWYPVTDHFSTGWPSFTKFGQGYGLSAEGMAWFWQQYLPDASLARHQDVSPLRAPSLEGLPPTWVMTAEYDVLRDEGEAFARRAIEHGVTVQLHRAAGMNHGFIKYAGAIDEATQAIASAGAWLRARVRATTEDTTP